MERETQHAKHHRQAATQVDLLSTTLLSPLSALFSDTPLVTLSPGAAFHRLALGLLYVACICFTLLAALVVAILIGVALVRFWVEEPVSLQSKMHFDYTHPHPVAAVPVGDGLKGRGIPAGHVARVWLELVMPESDYNSRVGVFQVTTEAISSIGNIVSTSSQPCMLKFRSLPIQLTRTFLMGIPLLMGVHEERQKLVLEVLQYNENNHKTEVIIVRLKPRAGTFDLPQIYEAHIIIKTQLPRTKELVYHWKWIFYIWISLYVYVFLLIGLCCCFNPFGFSRGRNNGTEQQSDEVMMGQRYNFGGSGGEISDEFSNALSRWHEGSRNKQKVGFPNARQPELEGSASSPAGETSSVIEDFSDFEGSESSVGVGG